MSWQWEINATDSVAFQKGFMRRNTATEELGLKHSEVLKKIFNECLYHN